MSSEKNFPKDQTTMAAKNSSLVRSLNIVLWFFFSRHGKKHRQLLTVTSWIHLTLSWRGHYHGTGFYMIKTSVMKELNRFWIAQVPWSLYLQNFVLYLLSSLLHLFIYMQKPEQQRSNISYTYNYNYANNST